MSRYKGTSLTCDEAVYANGVAVWVHLMEKEKAEALVVAMRPFLKSNLRLDWHYVGGYAVFKILEDKP